MNETNIKHGYSLMVRRFVKPGALFWIQGRKFQKQGQNLCHQGCNIEVRGAMLGPQGLDFFNYASPGGWTCQVLQVMHSGCVRIPNRTENTEIASMQILAGSALFSAPRGIHFQLIHLGSPQGHFMGKFSLLTSIKFLPPMPHPKLIQLFAPEKIEETWKKIYFEH